MADTNAQQHLPSQDPPPNNLQNQEIYELSDAELYAKCKEYGLLARVWKRRFAGLLPEVMRRELYKKRGFGSIYEFAFKIGGLSAMSVDKVLKIAERLQDKPILMRQLSSGEQGWTKIEKVAFIATPETDADWAQKVETMGQDALATYVQMKRQEMQSKQNGLNQSGENPLGSPFTENGNVDCDTARGELGNNSQFMQVWNTLSFHVPPQIEQEFRMIKHKLEQDKKMPLNFSEVLHSLITEKPQKEQIVIQLCPECAKRKAEMANGRYIPSQVRRLIYAKYRGFCAFPTCMKPAISLHHTKRYAIEKSHNINTIVPVCKIHERLLHSGMVENEEDPPNLWRLANKPNTKNPKFKVDQLVAMHRTENAQLAHLYQFEP